jgi:hypothetical protein
MARRTSIEISHSSSFHLPPFQCGPSNLSWTASTFEATSKIYLRPLIFIRIQFAYNEASYFLIRLLQQFDHVELAPDAQPADSHPPAEWANAGGRKGIERFWPKSHLTMYAHVREIIHRCPVQSVNSLTERALGADA